MEADMMVWVSHLQTELQSVISQLMCFSIEVRVHSHTIIEYKHHIIIKTREYVALHAR